KEPDDEQHAQEVLDIAEEHIEGRQQGAQSNGEGNLQSDEDRQQEQREAEVNPEDDGERRQQRQADQEVHGGGEHGGDGQDLQREVDLAHDAGVVDHRGRGAGQAQREGVPGHQSRQQEDRVARDRYPRDLGEDHGVDQHQQQWIEERPEDPQDGPAILDIQVASDHVVRTLYGVKHLFDDSLV